MAASTHALAVSPSAGDRRTAGIHAEAWFGLPAPATTERVEVLANNDSVQAGGRMAGPMRLGKRAYRDGLFVHARSELKVTLSEPATRFTALVGVDANAQTSGGRGSVHFRVRVGDAVVWESPLLREDSQPVEASAELAGASEFTLEVDDGGDGIACDQANWALARIETAGGRTLRLDELPLLDPRLPAPEEALPFGFTYGGKPWLEAAAWEREPLVGPDAEGRFTLGLRDPATGLRVWAEGKLDTEHSVLEWTVRLRNEGTADTPIIADLQGLDGGFSCWHWPPSPSDEFVLHHATGSPCRRDDFEPHASTLRSGAEIVLGGAGGRPTNSDLCYMDLAWPTEGVVLGIGWPGQWRARISREDMRVRMEVGQELTHFVLHPGEEARTPLIALLFHSGDVLRGQNLWRRWMVARNLPRPGGELPPAGQLHACSSHQFGEMIHADEASQIQFIDGYLDNGVKLDYWWMDAGWYPNSWGWPHTGTWEVDRARFPRGLRAITDHGHERDVRSIVWFEPERVTPGTWLYDNHPDWLLGVDGEQKLLNLGNPEARQWLTDHVDGLIDSEGIDLYRQDFNMDPLGYWRANDTEDRQGITEMRHCEGYLAYWDALLERHPNMLIDSCASGGRRNDLETLRRAVPLLRSDWILDAIGNQGHTWGLSPWVPYFGTGMNSADPYAFRSVMCPAMTGCWDVRRTDLDWAAIGARVDEWRLVAECFYGDFYPLTRHTLSEHDWIAWQYDLPEKGVGMVQAFRREDSIYESARLPLYGLEPGATYRVTDLDTKETLLLSGDELTDKGLRITFTERPESKLIRYERML